MFINYKTEVKKMKNISKIFIIALLIMAFAQAAFAIAHSVGLRVGGSYPLNDYNTDGYKNNINLMGGLGYEAWLKDWVSVGAFPYYTKLDGEVEGVIKSGYDATIIGAELQARFRPTKVAVLNFKEGPLQRIAPFAQIGLGAAHIDNDKLMDGEFAFMAPTAGLGVSLMSKWNVDLDLGVQLDHVLSDKVDNLEGGGKLMDSHLMPYIGLSYTFGGKKAAVAPSYRGPRRNIISMDEDFTLDGVQFEFGSNKLTVGAQEILDEVIVELKKSPSVKIEVHGHTDNVGKADYNITLSQERAIAVKDYMVSKGITASRIETKGFGDRRPVASNDTAEGRALNRRIDFVIVK